MVIKRDRWESSSDEEQGPKKKVSADKEEDLDTNKYKTSPEIGLGNGSSSDDQISSPTIIRKHNPLLQGCRSVYNCYERLSHIDEGTYGIVWKARDLATREIVALKQIKFDPELCKEGFPMAALREINVLMALSHENIVTVREMCVGKGNDKVYMVMEW